MLMDLEVRTYNNLVEVHVIDAVNGRPISIKTSNKSSVNSLIRELMVKFPVTKIYKSNKRLLINHRI